MTPRCLGGDRALWAALEAALRGEAQGGVRVERLRDRPGRRRLLRVQLAPDVDLFVKQHHARGRKHPLRDGLKRALRLDPAWREWRALRALRAAGVRVPRPRALGVLGDGDRVLAMDRVDATPLPDLLEAPGPPAPRRALAEQLGRLVASLHAAGWSHGDLHHGNFLVGADGPVLVDLQAARRTRRAARRRRDLGELDHALAGRLSLASRLRLRAAAVDATRPFSAASRRRLRAVGRAALRRRRAQLASRTRRALRPGRRFAAWRLGDARGLRSRALEEPLLRAALQRLAADADAAWLATGAGSRVAAVAHGDQRLLVTEFDESGALTALRRGWRGSGARRSWRGGLGLQVHRLPAPAPLAFLERRGAGPSTLVLRDPRPGVPADADGVPDAEAAQALHALLLRLHGWAVDAGSLRAGRVLLRRRGTGLEALPLALEALRFPRRLAARHRQRTLRALETSLAGSRGRALRRHLGGAYAALGRGGDSGGGARLRPRP